KQKKQKNKKRKSKQNVPKRKMLNPNERASAHYRAAKQYMSYGDTQKSKAHMKRALYYFGTGDKASELMAEIENADINDKTKYYQELFALLSKTHECIRATVVTEDSGNEGKIHAVENLDRTKSRYTQKVIDAFREGTKVHIGDSSNAYIKAPQRLYGIDQNKLINGSIGPNLVDPDHAIGLTCEFAFAETVEDTRKMHDRVLMEASKPEFVLKVLEASRDKAAISAKSSDLNADDRDVAKLISHFWSSVADSFQKTMQGAKVEPLAHSEPSNKGFAVFQLLVTFPEYANGLFLFSHMTDTMVRSRAANYTLRTDGLTAEEVAKEVKAWKSMLKLMLGAAIEMARKGKYYTLDWTDTEPPSKSGRTAE
ncbi:MAG: hypothetical protein EBZ77_09120, partial [Chitinophagia bacterium]|nr:hypothetical protein [Chitinophagia bacterium]